MVINVYETIQELPSFLYELLFGPLTLQSICLFFKNIFICLSVLGLICGTRIFSCSVQTLSCGI